MTATAPTSTPLEDREAVERIIAGFRAAMIELRCISSQRMIRQGLSMTNFHVLSMLERHGEMTMSHLAEMLDVSLSNATGLVDRMVERGLVERVRVADDRRVVLARITAHGRDLLAEVEVLREDIIGRVLGRLEHAQLERVAAAMEDLRAATAQVLASDPATLTHTHDHHRKSTASPATTDAAPRKESLA